MELHELQSAFKQAYNKDAACGFFSAGRVNLIGEHTDYNGGFVFPCALSFGTYLLMAPNDDKLLRFKSLNMPEIIAVPLDKICEPLPNRAWVNYPLGCIAQFVKRGIRIEQGYDMLVWGNVPNGAGLSSSAALEVVTAYAFNELLKTGYDRTELAKIGQLSEHEFAGVNCGIMDQFASVFGKAGCLMRLDCRSREFEYFPFKPDGYRLVLLDSVVKHQLAGSPYNDRRKSCENVVQHIAAKHPEGKFETLRDCSWEQLEEVKAEISEEDYRRAKFVLGEKDRVLGVCKALTEGDYEKVGELMYQTHEGLSKDYEVSCEELDFLNDIAKENGVTGSRIMGGGFGGCTINLVRNDLYRQFIADAKQKFNAKYGHEPKVYDVVIGDGSRRLC